MFSKGNVVLKTICLVLSVCLGGVYCYYLCPRTQELGKSREDYTQVQVANDIHTYAAEHDMENPTLFTYRLMDYGFYNAADIIPVTYFFGNNVFSEESFPEMYEQFDKYISTQASDFVLISKNEYLKRKNFFDKNYTYLKEYNMDQFNDLFVSTYLQVILMVKK